MLDIWGFMCFEMLYILFLGVRKSLSVNDINFFTCFNCLLYSKLDVVKNKKVKIFEKKVQKNLEVKKKVVPLQPV